VQSKVQSREVKNLINHGKLKSLSNSILNRAMASFKVEGVTELYFIEIDNAAKAKEFMPIK